MERNQSEYWHSFHIYSLVDTSAVLAIFRVVGIVEKVIALNFVFALRFDIYLI